MSFPARVHCVLMAKLVVSDMKNGMARVRYDGKIRGMLGAQIHASDRFTVTGSKLASVEIPNLCRLSYCWQPCSIRDLLSDPRPPCQGKHPPPHGQIGVGASGQFRKAV